MPRALGRPPSRPGLGNTTRRELCWHLAQGLSKEDAARRAGLPDTYRLADFARTKIFADELRDALHDHLGVNLAPKAVRILDEIMSDSKVTPRVRVDAAKVLLDRAGYAAREEGSRKPINPDESSWSIDELNQMIAKIQSKLEEVKNQRAEGATLIEGAVEETPAYMQ